MAYKIGTRVRVRCEGSFADGWECRIVAEDRVGYDDEDGWYRGYDVDIVDPDDGRQLCFESHELEPILDRHEPCEAEFKESLDELLSREVQNETVK